MASDETSMTEITIADDGRVFVFGLSREVLEVLLELCPHETSLLQRLERLPAPGTSLGCQPSTPQR